MPVTLVVVGGVKENDATSLFHPCAENLVSSDSMS